MLKLLIPLLASIVIPNAVNADLGSAESPDIPTIFPIKKGKSKTIEIQNEKLTQSISNEFQLYCGWTIPLSTKCKVQFKDGRLIVDDSLGIKPSQIKDILLNAEGVTISYLDQNNNWKLANIYANSGGYRQILSLYPFATRLFKWVNTGI